MYAAYISTSACFLCVMWISNVDGSNFTEISNTTSVSTSTGGQLHVHIHKDDDKTESIFNTSLDNVLQKESRFFISKIFKKYGNSSYSLDRASFEKMMERLGLGSQIHDHDHSHHSDHDHSDHSDHDHSDHSDHDHSDHSDHDHSDHSDHDHSDHSDHDHSDHSGHDHSDHSDHDHSDHSDHDHSDHSNHDHSDHSDHDHSDHSDHDHNDHSKDTIKAPRQRKRALSQQQIQSTEMPLQHIHTTHEECFSLPEMLEAFHIKSSDHLNIREFASVCPALIYQLDSEECRKQKDKHAREHHHRGEPVKTVAFDISKIPLRVWGYSCLAVLIISLVGVLGVLVIPIMQKVFYNHLLQFLVALAVGALSGDALLHLLPHSIMGSDSHKHKDHDAELKEEHDHSEAAWKGLMALTGILFFFVTERLLTIVTIMKKDKKSKKQEKKKRCEKYCDIESDKKAVGAKLSHRQNSEDGCDRTVMMVHPNKALKGFADATHDEFMHQCDEDELVSPVTDISILNSLKGDVSDDEEGELMELSAGGENGHAHVQFMGHGHSHGGHSHGHSHASHGHAHSTPNSVAAVAWMVILGDGIHNFSDGLAIGAAFAGSITGGFSTSVAVFCHELPHEIGDFAVLLRAGMPAKQAILYNMLSSVLCFFGMIIGVCIGNISSASLWIFAIVGGMFLYIALVDMLPEMSSMDTKKGENPFLHLLLQVIGILIGCGIMLLIALYEHDIKQLFKED